MGKEKITTISLARGMTATLPGGTRTSICVHSGRIRIRFPAEWLAETVVAREHHLVEGESLSLASGAWIVATATTAAEVLLIRKAAWWHALRVQTGDQVRKVALALKAHLL